MAELSYRQRSILLGLVAGEPLYRYQFQDGSFGRSVLGYHRVHASSINSLVKRRLIRMVHVEPGTLEIYFITTLGREAVMEATNEQA